MRYDKNICSFTGYRREKLQKCLSQSCYDTRDLSRAIFEEIRCMYQSGVNVFQCGMTQGSDLIFADTVLSARTKLPGIRFVAYVPCLNQTARWSDGDKSLYSRCLAAADDVLLVSNREYFDGCMQLRNRRLVDDCDRLLAVYGGQKGGTAQTIEYAQTQKKYIIVLNPKNMLRVKLMSAPEQFSLFQ